MIWHSHSVVGFDLVIGGGGVSNCSSVIALDFWGVRRGFLWGARDFFLFLVLRCGLREDLVGEVTVGLGG